MKKVAIKPFLRHHMTQADHKPKSDRNRNRINHSKSEKGSDFFEGLRQCTTHCLV